MAPVTTQHNAEAVWLVAEKYELDTLGAPFKVSLRNSVLVSKCPTTGDELVRIPDMIGLVSEIVRLRVVDRRKLSGADLRFIRKALDVRSNKLAQFLGFSPEHYSRLESGDKVMSPQAERLFRLFAFAATYVDSDKLLAGIESAKSDEQMSSKELKKTKELENRFVQVFVSMKIEPIHRLEDTIEYVLRRTQIDCDHNNNCDDEGDWHGEAPVERDAA